MARISLTVDPRFSNVNVTRFAIDPLKIIGLSENTQGIVTVSFVAANGVAITQVVENTYDEIMEAILQADEERYMELEAKLQ